MEFYEWKRLLFDWLTNSKLIKKASAESIDDMNLEEFFVDFKSVLKINDKKLDLIDFLKVNYPGFELHFFVDNELCREDYVFLYSIFLHYGCVICCNVVLQKASEALNSTYQMAMTVFLNNVISKNVPLSRSSLKSCISEAVEVIKQSLDVSYTSDQTVLTTPRSFLLEENNKEFYRLRNQIESEQFEINFLEGQIKDKDDVIVKLKNQQCEYLSQIKDLKNKLLYNGDQDLKLDGMSPNERLEVRVLRKNNSHLEDKIANLLIELNCVTDEKTKILGRLKATTTELKDYKEKTEELGQLVEEYYSDIMSKNQQISELVETNMELEAFITENKNLLNKNIDTLNSSAASFGNLSSSSVKSSNLGSCVIDIQLKEKEVENEELKENMKILTKNQRLIEGKFISLLKQTSTEKDNVKDLIESSNIIDDYNKVTAIFDHISKKLNEKDDLREVMKKQTKALDKVKRERDFYSKENEQKIEENTKLSTELNELKSTITNFAENEKQSLERLKFEVKNLTEIISVLKLEKESFKTSIEKNEESLFKKMKRIEKLSAQIENLKFENKKLENDLKTSQEHVQQKLELTIDELKKDQKSLENKLQEISSENEELKGLLNVITKEKEELDLKLSDNDNKIKILENEKLFLSEQINKIKNGQDLQIENLKQELTKEKNSNKNLLQEKSTLLNKLKAAELKLENCRPGAGDVQISRLNEVPLIESNRRSSLKNQLTSTPRLSMKQKVRLHNEVLRKRRISFLTNGLGSSESEEKAEESPASPCRFSEQLNKIKKRNASDHKSKSAVDRNLVNKIRKMRRQSTYNKSRNSLVIVETPQSFTWDNNYDFVGPNADFCGLNTEEQRTKFEDMLSSNKYESPKLSICFGEEETKAKEMPKTDVSQEKVTEVSNPAPNISNHSNDSKMSNKTHSINTGLFMISDKIPQTSVVQVNPTARNNRQNKVPVQNVHTTLFIHNDPVLNHLLVGFAAIAIFYYISTFF